MSKTFKECMDNHKKFLQGPRNKELILLFLCSNFDGWDGNYYSNGDECPELIPSSRDDRNLISQQELNVLRKNVHSIWKDEFDVVEDVWGENTHCYCVIKHIPTNTHYHTNGQNISHEGMFYSNDWVEVQPKEVTLTKWVSV